MTNENPNPVVNVNFSTRSNGAIAIISINYPPVNALSGQVRSGLVNAIESLENNDKVKVIIIRCQGKTFIAGADIKEFGKPATEPFLPDVVNRIEACTKPVIAALFGTSLGGGFEVALSCHYRVALSTAKVGLPEVNLGLIPGAGGTQRLMRILGPEKSLEMITSGRHINVKSFADSSLIDVIVEDGQSGLTGLDKVGTVDKIDKLDEATIAFASQLIETNHLTPKRIGDLPVDGAAFNWQQAKVAITKKARGKLAPVVAFDVLEKTQAMNISNGMAYEREQFLMLRASPQSAALIHAFGAEKKAAKISNTATPLKVTNVGIIGGGNMGSGIATSFLSANFKVQLIEQTNEALEAGLIRIKNNFSNNVKRGRMSQQAADSCIANLSGSIDYQALADCDLVLEAVFENIDVKKELFKKLTEICKPTTVFATNTSYLDINAIAQSISRPEQLVGMHFFSPANIMKLLEVVQADKTSEQVIATAMQVGKQLKKVSVLVGVCFGFAGNRMYTRYGREIQQMLLEGAKVEQIDNAMTNWGMAMGPLAVQDLSGIDIGHSARSAQPFPEHDKGYFRAAATMVEANRLGRKTKAGFYDYDEIGKKQFSSIVQSLLEQKAKSLNIKQVTFSDEQIVQRALFALISEGLALLKEGIVQRVSDIDVIWLHGYGFPRYKGGPMFQAKQLGRDVVKQQLTELRESLAKDKANKIWPEVDMEVFQTLF
ncbi:MAG: 3-hydroxyacyl-CoA dehydrogenase NAD-binding domain-containing protein [Colwellia sp.]|nr:3-hydroxyacyl-CoA dehydrogenase NAD-binding domain-containing protein [Colwellia sp.]